MCSDIQLGDGFQFLPLSGIDLFDRSFLPLLLSHRITQEVQQFKIITVWKAAILKHPLELVIGVSCASSWIAGSWIGEWKSAIWDSDSILHVQCKFFCRKVWTSKRRLFCYYYPTRKDPLIAVENALQHWAILQQWRGELNLWRAFKISRSF